MGTAATKRTPQVRRNAKPTTNAEPTRWDNRPPAPEVDDDKGWLKLLRRARPPKHIPEVGERALRKRVVLERRRQARARARANGHRG